MSSLIKEERMPAIWCLGCPLHSILRMLAKTMTELGWDFTNTVVVSGIGCTGRTAGYMNLDSVHTTHGRAICVAEGIKRANPKLNVVVVSGDGDLSGIGGNHLLHSSRRDTDIKVICANNEIYGLTGGQLAPTTRKKDITITAPYGNEFEPINLQGLTTLNKRYYYARTSPVHIQHFEKVLKEALLWKGFSFVDIRMKCYTNSKSPVMTGASDVIKWLMAEYKIASEENKVLLDNELGVKKNE